MHLIYYSESDSLPHSGTTGAFAHCALFGRFSKPDEFLKTTGAAALAVAASGMLAGCGEGYGATPGNPTLPTIDTGTYATFGNTYVDMGPLTGTWVSRTTYESDGWRHNYLYTGLSIDNTCLLYTSPSPRDRQKSRMPSSA